MQFYGRQQSTLILPDDARTINPLENGVAEDLYMVTDNSRIADNSALGHHYKSASADSHMVA